jgi:hypothetical protein
LLSRYVLRQGKKKKKKRIINEIHDIKLEKMPPLPFLTCRISSQRIRVERRRAVTVATSFQLPQGLDLLQREFEGVLLADDVQVFPDARVLAREAFDLGVREVSPQALVELAREVVVEFGKELDVQKEHSGGGKFVGDDVQEYLGTLVFVFQGGALLGPGGEKAHLDDVGAVAEEDSFSACGFI